MTKDAVLERIGAVAARLNVDFGVRELVLFGSVARGEGGPDSDVDLMVVFDKKPSYRRDLDLIDFLESVLHAKVDLITRDAATPRALRRIKEDFRRAA